MNLRCLHFLVSSSTLFIVVASDRTPVVSGFAPSSSISTNTASPLHPPKNQQHPVVPHLPTVRANSEIMAAAADASSRGGSAPKQKRVRIAALDGIRFLLACHIVMGHFLRYANPSAFLLKFFSQVNVSVGAFFALSGYVTVYTSTEVGQRKASDKLTETPSQQWWMTKSMAYFPMHWMVLALFSPMFLYSDVNYGGWIAATWHGIMSMTLTQAWFPMHAEVWNAPTWFLSSLTFSTALLPFCLPKMATMDKRALRKTGVWLTVLNVLPVLGYCFDHNVWALVEGITAPKHHPALAAFNAQRFLPIFNVAEVLLGAVACRLCMLDHSGDDDKLAKPIQTTAMSTLLPFLGVVGILAGRGMDWFPACSDLLIRKVLFVPLFLKFVMGAHRNAVQGTVEKDPLSRFLSSKTLVWLGGLAFPIFVVHGPLGQVFYKKLIATKLWGKVLFGPQYFVMYLATVFASALLLQKGFLQNKAVGDWSKKTAASLSSWM